MGNAATLPYDISHQIDYNNVVNWTLHEASKKVDREEQKENVSLFRVHKTINSGELALPQRTIQKLRTLKHPYVLKFLDTAEMEDSLALVTESCVPLETWLASTNAQRSSVEGFESSQEDDPVKLQEILWGFKCILLALNFLHSNCSLLHGNLGLHSIFVTPNGDWKLGGFELASNMSVQADIDHFVKHGHLLNAYYCSQERLQTEALRAKNPPYYVDMFSFGRCIEKVFALLSLEVPRGFNKYISAVLHADMKKRPTAQKLSESAMFNSEHLQFIESIGELALKAPKEFLELISQMEPKVAGLSRAVCAHKILPNLARTLQIAINDFPLRDAREGCRQSIQVSVNLLSKLASLDKLDPAVFRASWVPILVQLWGMSDRSVRTVMLQTLKALVPFVPDAVVNKSIFDNVLAGFADSNAKLRESTLMSLIFVVDKLDETQLQDRLVRSITNLQNDAEPSIRTNATIFLGKIASKLKEPVRVRVLCVAFQKAMKDNFMHCRVAGLRTANACVKLLDAAQMASKLVPQASILLLDKSAEVRSLAFTLVESCLDALRLNHEAMISKAKAEGGANMGGLPSTPSKQDMSSSSTSSSAAYSSSAAPGSAARPGSAGGSGGVEDSVSSGWSSWSVLQGISKSLESATIVGSGGGNSEAESAVAAGSGITATSVYPTTATTSNSSLKPSTSTTSNNSDSMVLRVQRDTFDQGDRRGPGQSQSQGQVMGHEGGFDEDDLDFDPDMHDDDADDAESTQRSLGARKSSGQGKQGWDEDFDDLGLDDDVDVDDAHRRQPSKPAAVPLATLTAGGRVGGLGVGGVVGSTASKPAVVAPKGMSLKQEAPSAGSGKAPKVPKVAVTKLSVNKGEDNWDDF